MRHQRASESYNVAGEQKVRGHGKVRHVLIRVTSWRLYKGENKGIVGHHRCNRGEASAAAEHPRSLKPSSVGKLLVACGVKYVDACGTATTARLSAGKTIAKYNAQTRGQV